MAQFQKDSQWNQQQTATISEQPQGFDIPGLNQPVMNDQQLVEIPTITPVEVDQSSEAPLTGVYSSSGFDMVGVLSRLVNRYNR
jgi:hypothetical protein